MGILIINIINFILISNKFKNKSYLFIFLIFYSLYIFYNLKKLNLFCLSLKISIKIRISR